MWGWTQKIGNPFRTLRVWIPGLQLGLTLPAVRVARWRRLLRFVAGSTPVLRLLPAVAGLVVCLDVAKLGFVLVWLEIQGLWHPPPWLPEEVRVLGLTTAYVTGVFGTFHFVGQIRRILWPPKPAPRMPGRRPRRPPDQPPEARHCGVPVLPRGPSPLVARCRRPATPDSAGARRAHTLGHAPPCACS